MPKQTRKRKVSTAQSVTAGSTIRIETPKSSRQPKPKMVVTVSQELNPASGFVNFLREHAVVGLAVGFAIGSQAQTVVKQLVASFIDPSFQLLFGKALQTRTFTEHWHGRAASFGWGSFFYVLLDFVFVLGAIYAIIKLLNLDKLDKPTKSK